MMFQQKRVLITGGGSGIGRATAVRMLEEGASVWILGNDRDQLAAAATSLGCNSIVCDVRDPAALEIAAQQIGQLDVVVVNAAVSFNVDVLNDPVERWRELLEINMWGTIHTCRAAGRQIIARGSGGRVIIVSSILSRMAEIGSAPYAMAKAAISQLGRQLAVEWAAHNILVNVVSPGCVLTPMSYVSGANEFESDWFLKFFVSPDRPRIPLSRTGRPEEIAEAILFFANPKNSYCTGQILEVDGGLTVKY